MDVPPSTITRWLAGSLPHKKTLAQLTGVLEGIVAKNNAGHFAFDAARQLAQRAKPEDLWDVVCNYLESERAGAPEKEDVTREVEWMLLQLLRKGHLKFQA